jgi:dihydroorotate dehydrogenase
MWHPWTCVRILKHENGLKGAVNAIGLTNPGLAGWIVHSYHIAKKKGYKIAASVKPDGPAEAATMATVLRHLQLAYVEVNVSCPNISEVPTEVPETLAALQEAGHPIVLKLSRDQVREEFIAAVDKYVEAYHAINTIPWDDVFRSQNAFQLRSQNAFQLIWNDKKSPIEKYKHKQKGGVSGDFIHREALRACHHLANMSDKPIIGGGGIFDLNSCLDFEHNGAEAFSIGTCFLLYPWRPNKIVTEYLEHQHRFRMKAT